MLWQAHDAEHWRRAWNAGEVRLLESAGSTNDVLADMAAQGAPHFSIVLAEEQTRGRGRGGARWSAPAGSSLLFSVLFRSLPDNPAPGAAPIRIGLSIARCVPGTAIKWPNDLIIPGHGKVAGILCEGTFGSHIIAGVGINVSQSDSDFPPELLGRATSLAAARGKEVDRAELLTAILRELHAAASRLTLPLDASERVELAGLDVLRGQQVICEMTGGDSIVGTARDIAADGALMIEQSGSMRRLYNGTVRLAMERTYPGSVTST